MITTGMLAIACLDELDMQMTIRVDKDYDDPDIGVNKHIFVALNFDGYDLKKSTFSSVREGVIKPAIKNLVDTINDDYRRLKQDNPANDFAVCFKTLGMPEDLTGSVARSKSAGLSIRVATQFIIRDNITVYRADILYEFKKAEMKKVAIVKVIKKCEPHQNGMQITAECFDGETRTFLANHWVMTGTSFEYGKDDLNIDPLGFGVAE